MAALIVIALRLVLPLSILRWPLAGGMLALVIDALDVVIVDAIATVLGESREFGPFYAQIDKWLDLYYLGLELVVVRRWPERLPRRAATALFGWRLVGVIAFEITAYRPLLVLFPNLYENLYIYVLVVRRWFPRLMPRTVVQTLLVLAVLLLPKLVQEWVLHWEELHPWQWLRETFVIPILGA
ncbi:MAG: hypothetical protein AB1736_11330 [Chloroflexota bacterium]